MTVEPLTARPLPGEIVDGSQLRRLLEGCVENLRATYEPAQAVFPYSSRSDGQRLVNDYRQPESLRYTVNTLLGLARAARAGIGDYSEAEVRAATESFIRLHGAHLGSDADRGLLLLLLVELRLQERHATGLLDRIRTSLETTGSSRFDMQDLGWMIWGTAAASRAGVPGADDVGRRAVQIVHRDFVDAATGMPRHQTARYRRNVVSFGSYTYFLRAMHEAAHTFGDEPASALFRRGVARSLELQGPMGEWPWLMNARTEKSFDVYPVFSVHQDSMAMLFLLPAFDAGLPGVGEAIRKSMAWVFGANELGIEFYRHDPFFAYRSIERADRAPRLRRYLRSLSYAATRRPGEFGRATTRLNDECRSYHLGWILYAWADRVEPRAATSPA